MGYNPEDWGRHAKKIVVEIDPEELKKPGVSIDLKINHDLKRFFGELTLQLNPKKLQSFNEWKDVCSSWRKKYPMVLPKYIREKSVNSYYFTERLSKHAKDGDTIVVDTSSPFHVVCQTWHVKKNQRFLTTGGISTMGY